MADDKTKRFRVHVVKELYETEKDYTQHLEFTVTVLLEKAQAKGQHDNTFTGDVLQKLFCNIEDILSLHRRLVAELESCLKGGPSYLTRIAGVYLKFQEQFLIYQEYGKGNEAAQKLLYELEDDENFHAFFLACLLLGGREDGTISSYLFKPIQRITKYPLLFRELEKYTPPSHPDYDATHKVSKGMRDICFVINEAKRRVEKLDAITDWQATVEGWEGSKVTDTCNELIKEGPLIKISVGNTQERMFFLFDNLLVYCKRSLLPRSRPLLFRGRIPMENLDVEDIEDGTANYHTSGITVSNSWKVHNIAKNKWFVLIAKSKEEKKEWMEAIHTEKEKRKRTAASRGRAIYNLMTMKGEKLHHQVKLRSQLLRDHKVRLRTFAKCFTGSEFVSWLVEQGEAGNADQAVILGQHLLENGIIHHVNDKHQFKNGDVLYRFRYDDGTYRAKYDSSELSARSVRMYCRLHGLFDPLIKDQKVGIRSMKCVVNAQKLIEWLLEENDISSREEGVALGRAFIATDILRHATDDQDFRDTSTCYRFTADDLFESRESRRVTTAQQREKTDFIAKQQQSCVTLTVPYSEKEGGYGVSFKSEFPLPVSVKSSSPHAQLHGVLEGQIVIAINGQYMTSRFCHAHPSFLALLNPMDGKAPPPLHLTVLRMSSEYVKLCPLSGGLGFHIKGSSPVVVHGVDKDSAAARAGLLSGSCILRVGEEDVMKTSHDGVVSAVKKSLQESVGKEGGPCVTLKVSCGHMEQMVQYEYETSDHSRQEVYERALESPYTFSVPAQFLKLLSSEAKMMAESLEACGVRVTHVTDYITDLKALAKTYDRAVNALESPRYPSYKPFGPTHAATLEGCPCNLHTYLMDVLSSSSSPQPTTDAPVSPASPQSPTADDDSPSPVQNVEITSYLISTMAAPSLKGRNFSKQDLDTLGHANTRRELLHELRTKIQKLTEMQTVTQRFIDDIGKPCLPPQDSDGSFTDSSGLLAVPPSLYDDITPSSSPSSSPAIERRRHPSVSDPLPAIKLEVEGFAQKVDELLKLLENRLLFSIMDEVADVLKKDTKATLLEFTAKLRSCQEMVRKAALSPGEEMTAAMQMLLQKTNSYAQEIGLFLSLSLAECDNISLVQTSDKLFSQCLVALATSFSHQLLAAVRGQLNSEAEYDQSNEVISHAWLQLIASKGVLLHMETNMCVQRGDEQMCLRDLDFVAKQLKAVLLRVVPMESTGNVKSELPEVTVSGSRSELFLTFALPPHLFNDLPLTLRSSRGVKVHPVLFNKGMLDLPEGSDAYYWEREVNNASLHELKDYYRQVRTFRLNRSILRQTSDEKARAIQEISQPLNALEILMRQIEVAVKEPTRPGIGLLIVVAELATRIGALRVNVCDSGVFRSGTACTLEQVMILARCHKLPLKNFRVALNTLRRKGGFSHILGKNNANIHTAFPQQPPKLYQLPADM